MRWRNLSMAALCLIATACGRATSVSDYEREQAEAARQAAQEPERGEPDDAS